MSSTKLNDINMAKRKVKIWEKMYIKEFHRKPSRDSIKEAPNDVKKAYKLYWKNKTNRDSCNFSDDSNSISNDVRSELLNSNSSNMNEPKNSVQCPEFLVEDDEAARDGFGKPDEVWGNHLNKYFTLIPAENKSSDDSLYAKMARKLREGAKINTRMSLNSVRKNGNISDASNSLLGKVENKSSDNHESYSKIMEPLVRTYSLLNGKPLLPRKYNTKSQLSSSLNVNALSAYSSIETSVTRYAHKKWDKEWVKRCAESAKPTTVNLAPDGLSQVESSLGVKRKSFSFSLADASPKKQKLSDKVTPEVTNASESPVESDFSDTENFIRSPTKHKKIKYMIPIVKAKQSSTSSVDDSVSRETDDEQSCEPFDELLEMEKTTVTSFSKKRKVLNGKERMEHKIKSGKLNENFVKINLKKKVYVRGKKKMSAKNYKIQEWKKKQTNNGGGYNKASSKFSCFECGGFGHWAFKCPRKSSDNLLPVEDMEEPSYLSLEEASQLAKSSSQTLRSSFVPQKESSVVIHQSDDNTRDSDEDMFDEIDESLMNQLQIGSSNQSQISDCHQAPLNPLYRAEDGQLEDTPDEVFKLLKKFGYKNFRDGQEKTIKRILCGLSTLLVLSTGSGKSLCYQLPAYLYAQKRECITLCISPLVSLMEDQVTGLPKFLKAVCLHTQQTPANREKALEAIRNRTAHILLLSPEAIVSSHGGGVLGTLLKELPPIAFACLDEAHCLSQWSHNFRPSYLQVCKVLKEKMNVNTILGLTATARVSTATSIAQHIGVGDLDNGIITGTCIPRNLNLSVSRDANREEALSILLKGTRFSNCESIIIYCTRREQCESIATLIRRQLFDSNKADGRKRRGISGDAEAYHAGLSAFRRQQIQKNFMSGKLRIVVATVAFGMGIDKSDVEGIIHYNMPKNLESYVQEIGRAGRNGNVAHCHLFLDETHGKDVQELKRHIYSNSIDRFTIRKLLNKIFFRCDCIKSSANAETPSDQCSESLNPKQAETQPDQCSESLNPKQAETPPEQCSQNVNPKPAEASLETTVISQSTSSVPMCPKHEVAIPLYTLVEELDMPEENIQTLLCYIELHAKQCIELKHHVYCTCSVFCYRGPSQLGNVSRRCPPLAAAIALQMEEGVSFQNKSSITFPVVDVSSKMGWSSNIVKQELKKLEWANVGGNNKKSGVKVEFSDVGFHMLCRGDLTDEEQDEMLDFMYNRTNTQEKEQCKQLMYTYKVLESVSYDSVLFCTDETQEELVDKLKTDINEYFEESNNSLSSFDVVPQLYIRPEIDQRLRADIRALCSTHSDNSWNGRAVARIFHGIGSPNYPATVWSKVRRFWRLHLEIDFNLIRSIAKKEIIRLR